MTLDFCGHTESAVIARLMWGTGLTWTHMPNHVVVNRKLTKMALDQRVFSLTKLTDENQQAAEVHRL